jgi:hypothetical protein
LGDIAVFGAFDLSANEHARGAFDPHYRPHIWAILAVPPEVRIAVIKRRLHSQFPKKPLIARSVYVKEYNGDLKGLAYGFKSWCSPRGRRITIPRAIDKDGNTKRQNTRSRKPRRDQFVEFLLLADQVGFRGRLFSHVEGDAHWPKRFVKAAGGTIVSA